MKFDDGKTGVLTLRPHAPSRGILSGWMFIPKAVIDFPPQTKRTGQDYNNAVFAEATNIDLGNEFTIYHEKGGTPGSGTGMFYCILVADDMLSGHTHICEEGGQIMQYPETGYPFQFMGSGKFIATP